MVLQGLHKHALLITLLKDSKGQYHLAKDSFRGQIKARNLNVWVVNIDFFLFIFFGEEAVIKLFILL